MGRPTKIDALLKEQNPTDLVNTIITNLQNEIKALKDTIKEQKETISKQDVFINSIYERAKKFKENNNKENNNK